MHDGRALDDGAAMQDSERLFRALNRLLHAPSPDARMQAEDAIRRHKALMPNPWEDAMRPVAGSAVVCGEAVGTISRSSAVA